MRRVGLAILSAASTLGFGLTALAGGVPIVAGVIYVAVVASVTVAGGRTS